MKRRFQFIMLLLFLFVFSNCTKKSADIVYDKQYIEEIKTIRNDLGFYLSRNSIPGANFAIAKKGQLIYSEGMGLASTDLEVPATRNTKFRIGDLSELFTSIIFQKMVDDGILHRDSTIQHYLPSFPEKEFEFTLQHLAYHTSGIKEASSTDEDWPGINISIQKGIENFKNDPLEFPPGWYQSETMYSYNLLGAIMEKASGKTYAKLLAEYVTDTLQLDNTVIDNPFLTIKGRTNYFDHNHVAMVMNATFRDLRYRAPSKGLLSTAEDLVNFGNAILYNKLMTEETKNKFFTPVQLKGGIPSSMANAWIIMISPNGKQVFGKKGHVTGGGSALIIIPEEELVIAGAINLTGSTDEIPVFEMAKHFLHLEESKDQ